MTASWHNIQKLPKKTTKNPVQHWQLATFCLIRQSEIGMWHSHLWTGCRIEGRVICSPTALLPVEPKCIDTNAFLQVRHPWSTNVNDSSTKAFKHMTENIFYQKVISKFKTYAARPLARNTMAEPIHRLQWTGLCICVGVVSFLLRNSNVFVRP